MKEISMDRAAVIFSIVFFLLYFSTLSISLDEEDSVHFALALREFNVTKYQPHPPGFPVYIALGMFFNATLGNEVLALTIMSALFGALTVYVIYMLFRDISGREIAFMSSVLTALTPLFWLNSVKALSDMAGLFFVLLSMLFIHRYFRKGLARDFYLSTLFTGIAAGVRIHALVILLPILAYTAYLKRKNFQTHLRGSMILAFSILVWLVPLVLVTGVGEYLSVSGEQYAARVDKPYYSLLGSESTPGVLATRAFGFLYYFLLGGYGVNLAGLGVFSILLLVFTGFLAASFLKKVNIRERVILFFVSGVIPYLLVVFIMLPPFSPRYFLILVPMVSLALAHALWNFKKIRIRYALFGFLVFLVASHSVFLALEIRSNPSPPVQLIEYVNENYGPDTIIALSGFAGKYFEYHGSDLEALSLSQIDCNLIEGLLEEHRTVLSVSGNQECSNLGPVEVAVFSRDPRVHIKRSRITLYEFLLEN